MKLLYTLIILSTVLLLGCSKKIIDFDMTYNNSQAIGYGDTLSLNFENILSEGSRRSFWSSHYNSLSTKTEGGKLDKNTLLIENRPTDFNFKKVTLFAEYDTKNVGFITKNFEIPLNFKGGTVIDFSGGNGVDGDSKRNRSGSKMLGRNGRDGFDGFDGEDGKPGANLRVNIWKPIPDSNYVYVMVTDTDVETLNPDSTHVFKYVHYLNGNQIVLRSNGGDGGNGGDGSDGGKGENGEIKKEKKLDPGDGGNGGNGGKGGNGGNSGFIMVYVHENAKEVIGTIRIESRGGNPGSAGKAGKAGEGGTPLEGQNAGKMGNPGIDGVDGFRGLDVTNSDIRVESFVFPE